VKVGGAQVVVGAIVVMRVVVAFMVVVMVMRVVLAQQPRAAEVHDEADRGDGHRLAVGDRHRTRETEKAFVGDKQRDHRQHDRAGERGQLAELAGTEREAPVMRVPPREQIRRCRDADGERMRRHVPAVGEQRHGSEDRASRDLDDHHRDGEADDQPGSALVARMPARRGTQCSCVQRSRECECICLLRDGQR
jgi:hypothetical protein